MALCIQILNLVSNCFFYQEIREELMVEIAAKSQWEQTQLNHYNVGFLSFPSLPFPSLHHTIIISQLILYLRQIKSYLHKIFGGTFCGCPTLIKTKKKQIFKQTNKQINNFQILYISAKSSQIFTIFRVTSCGCPKMVKIKKQTKK